MKNLGILAICCMVLLAGCQQADGIDNMNEELPVSIEASIGNMQMSRYASSGDSPNNLFFDAGDDIGLFMKGKNLVKWTKTQSGWSTETPLYWPNKSDSYEFYAYYPYDVAASMESVPMPSLAGQLGTIASLSDYDFLMAYTNQSYGTDGTVSFIGTDASFKHVSSLVAITIKGDCDLKTSTIQQISFSAPNIASGTTYSLSEGTMNFVDGKKSDEMVSGDLNYTMEGADHTFYFILNNGIAFSDITFSIKYSTNGTKYNAEKVGLGNEGILESGKRYNFNLSISDGVLTVFGSNIVDWGDGTQMDDIEINNPTEDNNQNDENT